MPRFCFYGPAPDKSDLTVLGLTLFQCNMKNVTITLDGDVVRWAKVWAASNDTSVSRMLGEELRRKMLAEEHYERAKRRFLSKAPGPLKTAGTSYPSRDIHP